MQHGLPIDAEISQLSPVAAVIEFSSVTSESFSMQHRPTVHIKNRAFNLIATIVEGIDYFGVPISPNRWLAVRGEISKLDDIATFIERLTKRRIAILNGEP